jgi:hypothetical protein
LIFFCCGREIEHALRRTPGGYALLERRKWALGKAQPYVDQALDSIKNQLLDTWPISNFVLPEQYSPAGSPPTSPPPTPITPTHQQPPPETAVRKPTRLPPRPIRTEDAYRSSQLLNPTTQSTERRKNRPQPISTKTTYQGTKLPIPPLFRTTSEAPPTIPKLEMLSPAQETLLQQLEYRPPPEILHEIWIEQGLTNSEREFRARRNRWTGRIDDWDSNYGSFYELGSFDLPKLQHIRSWAELEYRRQQALKEYWEGDFRFKKHLGDNFVQTEKQVSNLRTERPEAGPSSSSQPAIKEESESPESPGSSKSGGLMVENPMSLSERDASHHFYRPRGLPKGKERELPQETEAGSAGPSGRGSQAGNEPPEPLPGQERQQHPVHHSESQIVPPSSPPRSFRAPSISPPLTPPRSPFGTPPQQVGSLWSDEDIPENNERLIGNILEAQLKQQALTFKAEKAALRKEKAEAEGALLAVNERVKEFKRGQGLLEKAFE